MEFIPIKTRKMLPPKDDLFAVLDEYLTDVREGDIVLVTSKVVAIHQGRCVPVADVADKDALMRGEAEYYIERDMSQEHPVMLTIKHHTLIASAGIDESNANGHYILWPEKINETAKEIWDYLRKKHKVKNVGVILTDSHIVPMRWGVTGVAIGYCGFEPLVDLRGRSDIFGRKIVMTKQNIPDSLASIGVALMGEADECTPVLVVRGFNVTFTERDTSEELYVDPKDDVYKALLKVFNRAQNGN